MPTRKVLVVGGSGFVGATLVKQLVTKHYDVAFTYSSHAIDLGVTAYQVDLSATTSVLHQCIDDFQPDVIVHCAIVSTDDEAVQRQVNVQSVDAISQMINASTLLIYCSSNAVFNGNGPHQEDSLPQVRQDQYRAYGMTRAEGERIALEKCPNALVVRTDTVNGYDVHGVLNRRLRYVLEALQNGETITRFQDRYITPTLVDNLAEGLAELCAADFRLHEKILHIAGSERLTDYAYALALARHLRLDEGLIQPEVMEGNPQWQFSPRDNSLDVTETQKQLKTRLLNVREQLAYLFDVSGQG